MSQDRLLTQKQARDERLLQMSDAWFNKCRWLTRKLKKRVGPEFVMVSGKVFYRESAIKKYVDECAAGTGNVAA